MDLDGRQWSTEACALFEVDPLSLPEIVSCTTNVGTTNVFGPALPLTGLAVDQQAALFGEGCLRAGEAKCTYGTGAFLLANAGPEPRRSTNGLSASVAWDTNGDVAYCLDGQLYTVGSTITWLTELGLLTEAADLDRVGAGVPDSGGVTFIPALAGLGAPYWRPDARGSIDGLSLSTTSAHLVRAALEGIAAQVALLAQATVGRSGRAARDAAGRRWPHPVEAAHADPGRSPPDAGRGVRLTGRHGARGRSARAQSVSIPLLSAVVSGGGCAVRAADRGGRGGRQTGAHGRIGRSRHRDRAGRDESRAVTAPGRRACCLSTSPLSAPASSAARSRARSVEANARAY